MQQGFIEEDRHMKNAFFLVLFFPFVMGGWIRSHSHNLVLMAFVDIFVLFTCFQIFKVCRSVGGQTNDLHLSSDGIWSLGPRSHVKESQNQNT